MREKVDQPDDPRRCAGTEGTHQCWGARVEGSQYCSSCLHQDADTAKNKAETRIYHLAFAQDRHSQLSDHEEIRSLREEIALMRVLIEKRWNTIQSDTDLLAACGPLNTLVLTIEKLVGRAHQLETNLGVLLSKSSVMKLAQSFCQIVLEELDGVDGQIEIVDRISERLVETIAKEKDNA